MVGPPEGYVQTLPTEPGSYKVWDEFAGVDFYVLSVYYTDDGLWYSIPSNRPYVYWGPKTCETVPPGYSEILPTEPGIYKVWDYQYQRRECAALDIRDGQLVFSGTTRPLKYSIRQYFWGERAFGLGGC